MIFLRLERGIEQREIEIGHVFFFFSNFKCAIKEKLWNGSRSTFLLTCQMMFIEWFRMYCGQNDCCVFDEEEDLYTECECLEEMMTRKIFYGISEKFLLDVEWMNEYVSRAMWCSGQDYKFFPILSDTFLTFSLMWRDFSKRSLHIMIKICSILFFSLFLS